MKKIIITLFMFFFIPSAFAGQAQDDWKISLAYRIASRYVLNGVDLYNEHSISEFSMNVKKGGLHLKPYIAHDLWVEEYLEWGVSINHTWDVNKLVTVKGTFFPFGWKRSGKEHWGFLAVGEVTLKNVPLKPKLGYFRSHIIELPGLCGDYFLLEVSKNLGVDFSAIVGYNHGFLQESVGLSGALKIEKEIELTEKISVKPFFHWWRGLDKNEPVFGLAFQFDILK